MVYNGAFEVAGSARRPLSPRARIPRQWRTLSMAANPQPAKLSWPPAPHVAVVRQRLLDAMDAATQRPVALVSGGAGWGKTVLVASWVEAGSPPGPVGWLTLDAADNDPEVFWSDVAAALRRAGAVASDEDSARLDRVPGAATDVVRRFTHALARLPGPVVLVLDDLHEVDSPQVMTQLAELLRERPERLRLVLVTRVEPDLPLHRYRATGDLAEIREHDLEFGADEAAKLLAGHGVHLGEDELQTLLRRTTGWAAGLQLFVAFLTTSGGECLVEEFAGDVRVVADYLSVEVLDRQPPEVRQFLLYTSIADNVCGELADAITGGSHGQGILEQLERFNAFVTGIGSRPRWFRYHPLLRDLLTHQLRLQASNLLPELHLRAAHWYSGQSAPLQALTHAAASEDWRFLGRLVATHAGPMILTADRAALSRILERIPHEELSTTPELALCGALLLFYVGDYDAIPERIARVRSLLETRDDGDPLAVRITLRSLELAVARVRGDMAELVAASSDVLAWLTEVPFAELPSVLQYRAIARNNKGVGLLWGGRLEQADQFLWAGWTAARACGVQLVEINALGHLALLEFMRGGLQEAYEHAVDARDQAERRGWSAALQAVPAHLALALVELERTNIPEAQRALQRGLTAYRSGPEAAQFVVLRFAQIRLLLARGELAAARSLLRQTRRESHRSPVATVLDRWLLLAESEIDLAAGHPEHVRARYPRPGEDGLIPRELVCLARAELALGDPHAAEELLAPLRADPCDTLAAVEAWIVTALVADAQRQGNRSVEALAWAFELAEREGARRPFLTIGERRLAPLLERHRLLVDENAEFVADILAAMQPHGSADERSPLAAELSERELEVLRYLPTMFNAGEIADQLHVSVNTVKAHLRSIYRKLGATRRREAVGRARGLGIL